MADNITEYCACSGTRICPIYTNYVEQTGKKDLGVIIKVNGVYDCIALKALNNREIPKNNELEERLKGKPEGVVLKCDNIQLLNFLESI